MLMTLHWSQSQDDTKACLASIASDCKCDGLLGDIHHSGSEDIHQLHDLSSGRAGGNPYLHQHQLPFCTMNLAQCDGQADITGAMPGKEVGQPAPGLV